MSYRKLFLAAVIVPALFVRVSAQDFHLSQYDATPHYFNPALTGMYLGDRGDYRLYADYRSQWRAIASKPYSTAYLAYDMPYKDFGFGGYLVNNRSGVGNYNTFNFLGSAAYKIIQQEQSEHILNVGLQLGIIYKKFNPAAFTYETQYVSTTGDFDQTLPSGENFEKTSLLKFDANMGVFYKYQKADWDAHPFGGFSAYNVSMPNESFTGQVQRTPIRWVMHAGADWQVNPKLELRPMLLYMNQRKAHEFNIGMLGFYRLKETNVSLVFGADFRVRDAIVLQIGIKQDDHIFRISYDINSSYLRHYTGGRGAIEFSLVMTGLKGQPLVRTKSRF